MIVGISIPSLIAVLGGILTYGYISDIKNRQSFVQIADDLKQSVLEIRRNEKNFLHYKNNEHRNNLQGALSALTESVSSTPRETFRVIGEQGMSSIHDLARSYSDLVDRLNSSFQKESDITEKVRTEGMNLETFVASGKHAIELTTSFILRLRLLEKDYMLFRSRESYEELDRGLSQISNVMPFCYECAAYIGAVNNLFATYQESEKLTGELYDAGNKMEEVTEHFSQLERQKINLFIDRSQKLLLAALILLCTLGPLFVYKTSSFIAAPIKRLAAITGKISDGNITLRAPLKEQDETYSLALSFNRMLDSLLQSQQSLKESLELLNEKQAQLVESEKRASMGFLVAGVAHELNNPLNNISLTAETMKEEIRELSSDEISEYVQDILKQSERAHNIVVNLLDFARARKSSDMEKQNIVGVVKDSIGLVANQLRVSHIKLITDMPDKEYYLIGNRSKLEQVFISIMNNAIQAMKDDGTLTVSIKPDEQTENILVKITDTGKGIPERDLKDIFQPFFTTKPPGEGTGLGLAVSLTLVKEHEGDIVVKSERGSGTTFTVKIPLFSKEG